MYDLTMLHFASTTSLLPCHTSVLQCQCVSHQVCIPQLIYDAVSKYNSNRGILIMFIILVSVLNTQKCIAKYFYFYSWHSKCLGEPYSKFVYAMNTYYVPGATGIRRFHRSPAHKFFFQGSINVKKENYMNIE